MHVVSRSPSFPSVEDEGVRAAACVRRPCAARLLCKAFPGALDPTQSPIPFPAPTSPAISGLSLHQGLKCSHCPKIVTASPYAENTISKHFQKHRAVRTTRGGRLLRAVCIRCGRVRNDMRRRSKEITSLCCDGHLDRIGRNLDVPSYALESLGTVTGAACCATVYMRKVRRKGCRANNQTQP
jgi:hypothetical protein